MGSGEPTVASDGRGPTRDELLVGLDDDQREAVTYPALPLCVARRRRIGQDPGAHPPHRLALRHRASTTRGEVLALTFTRAAAVELAARVRALGLRDGVRAGTFHAVAWAELRARAAEAGRPVARC